MRAPSKVERLAGLYMDVYEANVDEERTDDLREDLFEAVKAARLKRQRGKPKRKRVKFDVSVRPEVHAAIRAASPQKRGRAQTRAVVEAALNADPAFAAYEVPRG